jgi:hypothetical protein
MSIFVENGDKAKLSIYHHLLSSSKEFEKLTCPIKSTEYAYLRKSRFISDSMQEEISLFQLCTLGHGINENIYLIGENFNSGILERRLYATFSYSCKEPIEFIIIPVGHYSDKAKDHLISLFSDVINKNVKNFLWRSLIENPYNKVYDELMFLFSGRSINVNNNFVKYCIDKN